MTAGARAVRPADPADRARRAGGPRAGRPRRRVGGRARPATRAARRTAASTGARLRGEVLLTVAAGAIAHRVGARSTRWRRERRTLLDRERTALVVDRRPGGVPQGRAASFDAVAGNAAVLVRGARILGVPVLVTEQYPRGPGRDGARGRRAPRRDAAPREDRLLGRRAEGFDLGGRDQALVCGIETHVCVAQTVARPARRGRRRSRSPPTRSARAPRPTASRRWRKMEATGAMLTSRRDGAVRAARRGRHARVQGSPGAGQVR